MPIDAASLPPFSNMRARCAQCGNRREIWVIFDRECAEVIGSHYHRRCDCGHRWVEQTSEAQAGRPLSLGGN